MKSVVGGVAVIINHYDIISEFIWPKIKFFSCYRSPIGRLLNTLKKLRFRVLGTIVNIRPLFMLISGTGLGCSRTPLAGWGFGTILGREL